MSKQKFQVKVSDTDDIGVYLEQPSGDYIRLAFYTFKDYLSRCYECSASEGFSITHSKFTVEGYKTVCYLKEGGYLEAL